MTFQKLDCVSQMINTLNKWPDYLNSLFWPFKNIPQKLGILWLHLNKLFPKLHLEKNITPSSYCRHFWKCNILHLFCWPYCGIYFVAIVGSVAKRDSAEFHDQNYALNKARSVISVSFHQSLRWLMSFLPFSPFLILPLLKPYVKSYMIIIIEHTDTRKLLVTFTTICIYILTRTNWEPKRKDTLQTWEMQHK